AGPLPGATRRATGWAGGAQLVGRPVRRILEARGGAGCACGVAAVSRLARAHRRRVPPVQARRVPVTADTDLRDRLEPSAQDRRMARRAVVREPRHAGDVA